MIETRHVGTDQFGQVAEQSLYKQARRPMGAVVYTERLVEFSPEVHPFLNDTFGTAMNVSAAFSGVPEIIHNGGTSTEWTGSAIAGTWNFADGGVTSLTSANNADTASFAEEGATTVDMSNFTALTIKINLTIYNPLNNSIFVIFDLAGAVVGNTVNLNDFIDTGLIGTAQIAVIPKADMGLIDQLVDGFRIIVQRSGGTKPTMTFDDIQLEVTGTPEVFKATTPVGTRFHISELRLGLSDNISAAPIKPVSIKSFKFTVFPTTAPARSKITNMELLSGL